ncbi:MAG: hypothetical protein LBI11_00555 [Streptococcaceae bacterium]|jgi:hypothetical protein|nr:hypothetical protein [Streptococcaceae bacterium]
MSIIFGLLLQFYLSAEVETYKNLKATQNYATAQLMATDSKNALSGKLGAVTFDKGRVVVSADKTTVILVNGSSYTFASP